MVTVSPNAPRQDYFHSVVYFDPTQTTAKPAALALAKLVEPADVKPLPKNPLLRALDPGAMLLFVTGSTFHNTLGTPAAAAEAPRATAAARAAAFHQVLAEGRTGRILQSSGQGRTAPG